LTLLQQGLVAELRRAGLRIKTRDHFTPHLTLLYASGTVAPRAVQPVSWVVREFVLVHSQIGRNLPYQVLGRWPLTHQSCIGER
jgi:2'-5' RNA ligase